MNLSTFIILDALPKSVLLRSYFIIKRARHARQYCVQCCVFTHMCVTHGPHDSQFLWPVLHSCIFVPFNSHVQWEEVQSSVAVCLTFMVTARWWNSFFGCRNYQKIQEHQFWFRERKSSLCHHILKNSCLYSLFALVPVADLKMLKI